MSQRPSLPGRRAVTAADPSVHARASRERSRFPLVPCSAVLSREDQIDTERGPLRTPGTSDRTQLLNVNVFGAFDQPCLRRHASRTDDIPHVADHGSGSLCSQGRSSHSLRGMSSGFRTPLNRIHITPIIIVVFCPE